MADKNEKISETSTWWIFFATMSVTILTQKKNLKVHALVLLKNVYWLFKNEI